MQQVRRRAGLSRGIVCSAWDLEDVRKHTQANQHAVGFTISNALCSGEPRIERLVVSDTPVVYGEPVWVRLSAEWATTGHHDTGQ